MGAVAQVGNRNIYEKTNDVGRMLNSGQIAQAILTQVKRQFAKQELETNIFDVLPARAATSTEYKKGATDAWFWNEGGKKKKMPFPLNDGYYLLGEGANEFGVPNGEPSNRNNPNALYLVRHQDSDFSGPVGLGGNWVDGGGRRGFLAGGVWSVVSGVALVGREATAPLVALPAEKLANITNPKDLVQRAEQLEVMAGDFNQRFGGGMCSAETYQRFVTEPLETAKLLRKVAGEIEAAKG